MARNRPARPSRGAAAKLSLALTGVESFLLLIISIVLLISSRTMDFGSTDFLDTSSNSGLGWVLNLITSGIGEAISGMLLTVSVILLICGIWSLIFWIICAKSRTHRVRNVVCTIFGRMPGLILIFFLLSTGAIGWFLLIVVLWVFLMILFSAVGWRRDRW